jgi:hypothetical protein
MKSIAKAKTHRKERSETSRLEYRFDYTKAQPNRFAGRGLAKSVVVLLDPDVAKVFKSAESVNSALRAILPTAASKRSTRRSKS